MNETSTSPRYDFGIMGLGTMGKSLLLNMADHGNAVAGWNRDPAKVDPIVAESEGKVGGFSDMAAFVASIRTPRAIMILVPAGDPTDAVIGTLTQYLEPGDFIIDGGNAHFRDTERRLTDLEAKGFGFMGMGVSGGEEGARRGPSMMPGGTPEQYERVRPVLESIAAKYDGEPCVARMGARSAGHYVKMVHNGIEYAVMQLISEFYDVLHRGQGRSDAQIAKLFAEWNEGDLQGFLIEITSTVLAKVDEETGESLVSRISDKAKAKGTGKWTSQDAMDLGVPIPSIDAAVSARIVSNYQAERRQAEGLYGSPLVGELAELTDEELRQALLAGTILCYAQGLAQIRAASDEYGYGVDLATAAKVWRAGCIIRSRELAHIQAAYAANSELKNILLDAGYVERMKALSPALRSVVAKASAAGFPVPSAAASLAYFDAYRTGRLPANLIQAQRDLFGAHTYERLDREGSFHTHWE